MGVNLTRLKLAYRAIIDSQHAVAIFTLVGALSSWQEAQENGWEGTMKTNLLVTGQNERTNLTFVIMHEYDVNVFLLGLAFQTV